MNFKNKVGHFFAWIFGNFSIKKAYSWGQQKQRGCKLPRSVLPDWLTLTVHATTGMNTFFCGFPSVNS